ncbi:MAG: hypothetical protein LBK99_25535 [Opitutaceae bacterium]|jgi:energy-converting hydrogenase Eha subunit A|nr:hypothetical protein [Opitutaceae bacterium]
MMHHNLATLLEKPAASLAASGLLVGASWITTAIRQAPLIAAGLTTIFASVTAGCIMLLQLRKLYRALRADYLRARSRWRKCRHYRRYP